MSLSSNGSSSSESSCHDGDGDFNPEGSQSSSSSTSDDGGGTAVSDSSASNDSGLVLENEEIVMNLGNGLPCSNDAEFTKRMEKNDIGFENEQSVPLCMVCGNPDHKKRRTALSFGVYHDTGGMPHVTCCVCQRKGLILHTSCCQKASKHVDDESVGTMKYRTKCQFVNYKPHDDDNAFRKDKLPTCVAMKCPGRSTDYLVYCKSCLVEECLLCGNKHNSGNCVDGCLPVRCVQCRKWSYGSKTCSQGLDLNGKLCKECSKDGMKVASIATVSDEAATVAATWRDKMIKRGSQSVSNGARICSLFPYCNEAGVAQEVAKLVDTYLGLSVRSNVVGDGVDAGFLHVQKWFDEAFSCYRDEDEVFAFLKGEPQEFHDGFHFVLKKDMKPLFQSTAWLNDVVIDFIVQGLLNLWSMVNCEFPASPSDISFGNSKEAEYVVPSDKTYADLLKYSRDYMFSSSSSTEFGVDKEREKTVADWFWATTFRKHSFSFFCDRTGHIPRKRIVPVNIHGDHWVVVVVTFPCYMHPNGHVNLLNHIGRAGSRYSKEEMMIVCWFAKYYGLFFNKACGIHAAEMDYSINDFKETGSNEKSSRASVIQNSSFCKGTGGSRSSQFVQQTDGHNCGVHVIQDCCEALSNECSTAGLSASQFRVQLCYLMMEIHRLLVVPPVRNMLCVEHYGVQDTNGNSLQVGRVILRDLAGVYHSLFGSYDRFGEQKQSIGQVLHGELSKVDLVKRWLKDSRCCDDKAAKCLEKELCTPDISKDVCIVDLVERLVEKEEQAIKIDAAAVSKNATENNATEKLTDKEASVTGSIHIDIDHVTDEEKLETASNTTVVENVLKKSSVSFHRAGGNRHLVCMTYPCFNFNEDELFYDAHCAKGDEAQDIVSLVRRFFLSRVAGSKTDMVDGSCSKIVQNAMEQFRTYFLIDKCNDEHEVPVGLRMGGDKSSQHPWERVYLIKCAAIVEHNFSMMKPDGESFEDVSIVHWIQTRNVRMENCGYATYLLSCIFRQSMYFPDHEKRVFFVSQPGANAFKIVNERSKVDAKSNHHRFFTDTRGGDNCFTAIYSSPHDKETMELYREIHKGLLFPASISYRKVGALRNSTPESFSSVGSNGQQGVLESNLHENAKIFTLCNNGYSKVKYVKEEIYGWNQLFGWTVVRYQQEIMISSQCVKRIMQNPGKVVNVSNAGSRNSVDSAACSKKLCYTDITVPAAYTQADDGKYCTWLTAALLIRIRSPSQADKMIEIVKKCTEKGKQDVLSWLPFLPFCELRKGYSLYDLLPLYTHYSVRRLNNIPAQEYASYAMNTKEDRLLLCQLEDTCGVKSHCIGISTKDKLIYDCNEKHPLELCHQSLEACVGHGSDFKKICFMVWLKSCRKRKQKLSASTQTHVSNTWKIQKTMCGSNKGH